MFTSRDFFENLGIFCFGMILFTYGVHAQAIIGFESRFYLFALEMWQHGLSWFPTTYSRPYPDYPATSTWLIYLSAMLLGKMDKMAAVLPTAVAASITLVVTYRIAALQNKRWGVYAVLFLLMTIVFFQYARSISIDMLITMVTACCFYIIHEADVKDRYRRIKFVYLLFLFGFFCRGPIGLIIPAGVVCMYHLQDGNPKRLFISGAAALLLLMLSMLFLLMAAGSVGGHEFVHAVLRKEIVGRMGESHLPTFFYFTQSMKDYALAFPFAVLTSLGLLYYEQRLHAHPPALKLLIKCFGWAIIILVGLSIPGDKKIRYILPAAPAFALLASYLFIAPISERYFTYLRWIAVRLFLLFPGLLFIGLRVAMAHTERHGLHFSADYALLTKILFALLACSASIFVFLQKKQALRDVGIVLVAAISFIASYFIVIEPIQQSLDGTHRFVTSVEAMRYVRHAHLVFFEAPRDGWPIKYLANAHQDFTPAFANQETELWSYPSDTLFITSEENFRALSNSSSFHPIIQGEIGRRHVIVFER